jgi:hypothetical protein
MMARIVEGNQTGVGAHRLSGFVSFVMSAADDQNMSDSW